MCVRKLSVDCPTCEVKLNHYVVEYPIGYAERIQCPKCGLYYRIDNNEHKSKVVKLD